MRVEWPIQRAVPSLGTRRSRVLKRGPAKKRTSPTLRPIIAMTRRRFWRVGRVFLVALSRGTQWSNQIGRLRCQAKVRFSDPRHFGAFSCWSRRVQLWPTSGPGFGRQGGRFRSQCDRVKCSARCGQPEKKCPLVRRCGVGVTNADELHKRRVGVTRGWIESFGMLKFGSEVRINYSPSKKKCPLVRSCGVGVTNADKLHERSVGVTRGPLEPSPSVIHR
jgi:hypothetical protein